MIWLKYYINCEDYAYIPFSSGLMSPSGLYSVLDLVFKFRKLYVHKLLASPYFEVYIVPPKSDSNFWSVDAVVELFFVNTIAGGKPETRVCSKLVLSNYIYLVTSVF